MFNFIPLHSHFPLFVKALVGGRGGGGMCHRHKDIFISVIWAEKRLDPSHEDYWSGEPVEGRVLLVHWQSYR